MDGIDRSGNMQQPSVSYVIPDGNLPMGTAVSMAGNVDYAYGSGQQMMPSAWQITPGGWQQIGNGFG